MKINAKKNTVVCGNNIEWLSWIDDESIDVCYIDPPFFSNRNYEVVWGNGAELRSFNDRFEGGIGHYIEWMRERVSLIHKKLKPSGSIFLHCDWHASHRLRVMLDEIFGEDNFRNEIIWQYSGWNKHLSTKFESRHDSIFFYAKSNKKGVQKFKGWSMPWNSKEEYVKTRKQKVNTDNDGREYVLSDGGNGSRVKRYLDEAMMSGKPIDDVWNIDKLNNSDKEKIGYPTQKPEKLISRIIESCTDEDDLVLDCFAGGGTTAKVCADLKRKFIVGDVSPVACRVMAERIITKCSKTKFEIKNLPTTEEEFRNMDGHEFAKMFCEIMGWEVNSRQTGDKGIDGWDGKGTPVQVKNQKNKSGRPDVQKFLGALMSERSKEGKFVSWGFSTDAMEYIATIKRDHGIVIEPIKCADRLGSLILSPEKQLELQVLYEQKVSEGNGIIELRKSKPSKKAA